MAVGSVWPNLGQNWLPYKPRLPQNRIFELLINILQSSTFRIFIALALSTLLYEAVRTPRARLGFPLFGINTNDGHSRRSN